VLHVEGALSNPGDARNVPELPEAAVHAEQDRHARLKRAGMALRASVDQPQRHNADDETGDPDGCHARDTDHAQYDAGERQGGRRSRGGWRGAFIRSGFPDGAASLLRRQGCRVFRCNVRPFLIRHADAPFMQV
jgi:hypothetical protein